MAQRSNPYEKAFADYLRSRGIPFVPVNESRKAIFCGAKVKSFDFLVYPGQGRHWIVDIKGRKFPYLGPRGGKRYWENWVVQEDLLGLSEWQEVFGDEFEARFIFVYHLQGPPDRWPPGRPHVFQDQYYAFLSVPLRQYEQHCRTRSQRWETVSVPARSFRQIVEPIEALTQWDD